MIHKIYEAAGTPGKRYVRAAVDGVYVWCTQSVEKPQYDVAQGICDAEEMPQDVKEKADGMRGCAFSYVEWPL